MDVLHQQMSESKPAHITSEQNEVAYVMGKALSFGKSARTEYGLDILTGKNVAYIASMSILPYYILDHFESIYAAGNFKAPMLDIFANVYNTYFAKMEIISRYNCSTDYVDCELSKIIDTHSKSSLQFLSSFGASFKDDKELMTFVDTRVTEWMQPFFDGMDHIVLDGTSSRKATPNNSDLDYRFAQLQIRIRALQTKMAEVREIGQPAIPFRTAPTRGIKVVGDDIDFLINDIFGPDPTV